MQKTCESSFLPGIVKAWAQSVFQMGCDIWSYKTYNVTICKKPFLKSIMYAAIQVEHFGHKTYQKLICKRN